ncbi:hypothetical protein SO3561_09490 [Streptomyces olivochromogenes]|uniref:Uncharacterized protein n=1 Tax=Streptomyces olivochromogenes TaxID=1963 RepID=A0A250VV16_STROL|nr:hypothetical protein SO3561_09490 [Streptomyces olivochromogenes]
MGAASCRPWPLAPRSWDRAAGLPRRMGAAGPLWIPSRGAAYGLTGGQPMPVTWSAVVQLFLMALRAAERVMVPLQTAFFSFVSVPSLV